MTRADLAVQYASRGWAVFPLRVGGKKPAARSGVYAGTTDLVTVRRWWRNTDYNIGIWTGASNLFVLDLDVYKPDKPETKSYMPGITWWTGICDKRGVDPLGTYCVTTPTGGLHVYFAVTDGTEYGPSAGQLSPLVDTRGGPSYVVAGGSETDAGEYEAIENDVASMPDWLELLVNPPKKAPTGGSFNLAMQGHDDPDRWLNRARDDILSAHEGQRNDTFNWVAYRTLRHMASRRDEALDILRACAGQIGLTDKEIRDTLNSVLRSVDRTFDT